MRPQRGLRLVVVGGLLAALVAAGPPPAAGAAPKPAARKVGSLTLVPCKDVEGAWCGHLAVPFDYRDPAAGSVRISFEWYPASGPGRVLGTVVAEEGGPGYPSTGSRDAYLQLFEPLLGRRNLLLVDNRGTGTSEVVDCKPLQAPCLSRAAKR